MKKTSFNYVFLLVLILTVFSCKKFIEQQQRNALVDLVTKGTWRVSRYLDHETVNLTDSFSGYAFQFYENGTVSALKGSVQTSGSWSADVATRTITSNFPQTTPPVNLLNYTWKITDSYSDSVAAKTPVDTSFNILNLHKN